MSEPPASPPAGAAAKPAEVFANLAAELHYPGRPPVDSAAILAAIQPALPSSRVVSQGENGFSIAHPGFASELKASPSVIQTVISHAREGSISLMPQEVLKQTFDWPGARDALTQSNARLLVGELSGGDIGPPARVRVFNTVLRAVLEAAMPLAIHCVHAQKLANPAALLPGLAAGRPSGQLFPHVNVRFHVVAGRPQEKIMDTLGMATLGLPDVQCHFQTLDPNKMAPYLFNVALYIFTKGPVLQAGQLIQGLEPGQNWKCTTEQSLLPPHRPVLDLNPGAPYVAGDRPA